MSGAYTDVKKTMVETVLDLEAADTNEAVSTGDYPTGQGSWQDAEVESIPDPVFHIQLQPSLTSNPARDFLVDDNFAAQSRVAVLRISDDYQAWLHDQNESELETLIEDFKGTPDTEGGLLAVVVFLERSPAGSFGFQASITRQGMERMVGQLNLNEAFIPDLLARPDYWCGHSTVQESTNARDSVIEFFLQHPRWLTRGRHHKTGNRPPCAVYMRHDGERNKTFYVIVVDKNDPWIASLIERLRMDKPLGEAERSSLVAMTESPFCLHAIMAGLSFDHSVGYVTHVRRQLMKQIIKVNDYSDEISQSTTSVLQRDSKDRAQLEDITRQLHHVSQLIDSGMGSCYKSIKLSEEMLLAFEQQGRKNHAAPGIAAPTPWSPCLRRTHESLQYIQDAFHAQQDWLNTYRARKDTAMNFVFNMVMQHDSAVNIEVAWRMSKDSSSMNTITILTMIFLPGTFISTVFSSGAFRVTNEGSAEVTQGFWPFIGVVLGLTIFVVSAWHYREELAAGQRALSACVHRRCERLRGAGKGADLTDTAGDDKV